MKLIKQDLKSEEYRVRSRALYRMLPRLQPITSDEVLNQLCTQLHWPVREKVEIEYEID